MTKIEWCDITINPITGCGNFGNEKICGNYCYAARMAKRLKGRYGYPADEPFRPTFHPDRLQEITWHHDRPMRIFLNSMSDWFGPGVDSLWILEVLKAVQQNKKDTFFVLTKRPEKEWILEFFALKGHEIPKNIWWGVSVTRADERWRIRELLSRLSDLHKFVSFEPLHGLIIADLREIEWIIIGAETGNRKGKINPKQEWIETIIHEADDCSIPIFMKDNLKPYLAEGYDLIQGFPRFKNES